MNTLDDIAAAILANQAADGVSVGERQLLAANVRDVLCDAALDILHGSVPARPERAKRLHRVPRGGHGVPDNEQKNNDCVHTSSLTEAEKAVK